MSVYLNTPPGYALHDGRWYDLWAGANPRTGTQPLQSVFYTAAAPTMTFTLNDSLTYTLVERGDISYEMFFAPVGFLAPVASMVLAPSSITLLAGATAATTVTLYDSLSTVLTGRTITYDTADHSIATVNSAGVVTAVAHGLTTLTAYAESKSVTIPVTVNVPNPWSTDFTVDFGP